MTTREWLSFDDVLLVPKKGKVESRDEVNLHTRVAGSYWQSNPILSSPMQSVSGWEMCRSLSNIGSTGILHRFSSISEQVEQYRKTVERDDERSVETTKTYGSDQAKLYWAGAAFGLKDGHERLARLFDRGCRLFVLDIAHGHSASVESFMEELDNELKHMSTFIGGSVATAEGALFLAECGFNGIRVGIGNGSACSTRNATGFGVPQFSALHSIKSALAGKKDAEGQQITIISDGGCRDSGDIVKALAAGANAVLLGQLLAGASEAPFPGEYFGEASAKAKGSSRYVEGVSGFAPDEQGSSAKEIVKRLCEGIRSGISYGGGRNPRELQQNAEFVKIAPGVKEETRTRLEEYLPNM